MRRYSIKGDTMLRPNHDDRARIYEPNELPFWLDIGPIVWEGTYGPSHLYVRLLSGKIFNVYAGYIPDPHLPK